ncbi:putative glyoxalase/bleomycin resistance protein/dioxygenas [Klebsiella pneumoniae]|uniref:Putative glyoxalase/bleomycin resistance protein/dioxygenas n=1 Tax=Klebsiella pneumoniae TaxID=573 RepID=A0A377WL11_KLEPN|nr:putative glyoxalase/bleomycin resistance protein/dioxygenas [Klebsiella pneumoniae]
MLIFGLNPFKNALNENNVIKIEEDNVRFLLIRGPDGERLEFDACKR